MLRFDSALSASSCSKRMTQRIVGVIHWIGDAVAIRGSGRSSESEMEAKCQKRVHILESDSKDFFL